MKKLGNFFSGFNSPERLKAMSDQELDRQISQLTKQVDAESEHPKSIEEIDLDRKISQLRKMLA